MNDIFLFITEEGAMSIDEALKYFQSGYEMCSKLGVQASNYTRWKVQNFIPLKQQLKINQITGANMPIDIDKKSMEGRISKISGNNKKN